MLDVLIRGGRVVDGSGSPWFRADVGIVGDRIAAVGALGGAPARRSIDADGLVVCPGFVDMHAHSDLALLAAPTWEVKLAQGVTLEVLGQDGLGLAPVTPETREILHQQLLSWNGPGAGVERTWTSVGEYLARFDGQVAPNVAVLVPHGTVRMAVMGLEDRAPTGDELARMRSLVRQGMQAGAVGMSAGLTYAPAMYADDDELVALCEELRPFGGHYQPHHRNYGSHALQAYQATIDIARRAGMPLHLTHALMNFAPNKGRAGEMLALVDGARAEGLDVTLDTYPYTAGMTYLHGFLPGWAQAGGAAPTLARLRDPSTRTRIRNAMEEGCDGFHGVPIDWEIVVLAGVSREHNRRLVGQSVAAAAREAGQDPFELCFDLLLDEELGVGALAFGGHEENIRLTLQHPAHMAGSDGIVVGDRPHPRAWGTFPRYLAEYVRRLGLLRLEEMVRHMTSAPCARLGVFERGLVRPGMMADVVCFDPERVQDTATYEQPRSLPDGIPYVLVNGVLVKDDARPTGATPGRAVRRRTGAAAT